MKILVVKYLKDKNNGYLKRWKELIVQQSPSSRVTDDGSITILKSFPMINGTYYQLTRNSKKLDFLRYVFFIARVVFITESANTAVIHSVHWSRSDLK